jgi:hypothetical protein
MRNALIAAFVAIVGFTCAADAKPPEVDLDKPGALEALERDHPQHHKRILEEISKAQTIYVDPVPTAQNAAVRTDDPRRKGASLVLPSSPAKKRLAIPIEGVVYRVTAHMTEEPGKLEKAK